VADPGTDENPFIERPDEHAELGDELYCWMPGNGERQCGPDCVAYDEGCIEDDRKTPCLALNTLRVFGIGMQVLAGATRDRHKEDKARAVTAKVQEIPGPPEVK